MAIVEVRKQRTRQVQPTEPIAQKPVIATPKPPPETPKPEQKPKPKKAEVIQLEFNFPERARPVSNATVRTALFAAIQGEDREYLKKAVLASQNSIEIIFTGEQLNQDDHDVFMQLMFMASHKPLGETITVPANAILLGLGRGKGKSQHEQLKNDIHRLVTATVNIKCNGINFIGNLLGKAWQDEALPAHQRNWVFMLHPEISKLFGYNQYTIINWEQRKKLKQKDLARWLHLYIASHANPFPVSVEFLRNISGSKTKELRYFRKNLKIALEALVETDFITSWSIDENDLVRVERLASVTQFQSTSDNQPVLPAPPPAPPRSDGFLQPTTIEKFKALYPRLDVYACQAAFHLWVQGKTQPTNYDVAFLGFAKKWVKGQF